MRIILTHEQADFDALGALLAAYLLDESAIPVLPRRINRNGRAFLTLYGAELPFIDPRDLPSEPIDQVLLVDTQSLITLKGLGTHTKIRVVDHHTTRPDLPADWQVTLARTGACTTLLVDLIQEQNNALITVPQATLLLLGIYEDTGSLSYGSTTARDARAAAFLMEQGANLSILMDFLNPPLSQQQLLIYEKLLQSSQSLSIHGQTVVIGCADARNVTDEISSVAHKLRDTLDPDALFLLLETGEGIRLIARSTTEQINVSAIAAVFGGGGHERASAALIHPSGPNALEENRQRLIDVLPGFIIPAVTVGQIMSRRPRLLTPHTSAEEAAQLMGRYGYEGYPVVQDGQVIGLLTRRAVDRAISHKLNLPVSSLMDAGKVTIHPDQSLDHLQRVMADSGWGQIPVVDPATNEIIGIVTRTDLLKTMAPKTGAPPRQNLASQLEAVLPPTRLALLKAVAAEAHNRHFAVYIVGGFVRDLLLERPGLDFDLVVEGDAIALAHTLASSLGGRVVSHGRFGTAKWHLIEDRDAIIQNLSGSSDPAGASQPPPARIDPLDLPESLDIISARTEYYEHPTALPTVERSSIKLDLQRRDFTINTLALRLDGRHYGELHDYFGGLVDLERRLVRVLHSLSFIDDPTRLLRAVRFEQRFNFSIERRTLDLMGEARGILKQVSGERLHHELDLILAEERARAMLDRLEALEILPALHPALHWVPAKATLPDPRSFETAASWNLPAGLAGLSRLQIIRYLVWLVSLSESDLSEVCQRLKLHGGLVQLLRQAKGLLRDLPALDDLPVSQLVRRLDKASLLAIFGVYLLISDEKQRERLGQYATAWRHVMPTTDGHDLEQQGLPPSPIYHFILDNLRDAWLDGKIHSADEEKVLLDQLIIQLKETGSKKT